MRRVLRGLLGDDGGSVAPVVGLSLIALIAVGGIAFDYARLAAMDTELQNAADQSALAAAGQLDGEAGACARAAAAAAELLSNETLFANETAGRAVNVQNEGACDATGVIRFYQSYNQVTDTPGAAATSDADAKVVIVRVDPREAFYALTPVVGALSSGQMAAEAVASLGSGVCKVPPVMMCNPDEPDGNTDINFDFDPPQGAGLRLVINAADAPGNFGFLRIDDANGAREVARQLGYDNPPQGCIRMTGVETQPGDMQAVRAAFNTRFDISENGSTTCPPGGTCSPSTNSRKDLVRSSTVVAPAACALSTNTGTADWHEALDPYRITTPTALPTDGSADPEIMGYPRDMCHAVSVTGVCSSVTGNAIVGDGDWDRDAFFRVNYGLTHDQWMDLTDEDGNPLAATEADVANVSRYDVYKWEVANPTNINTRKNLSGGFTSFSYPVCRAPGITPGPTSTDRRRIPVAVVNCEAQNLRGHRTNVAVRKWLDVFLVEPSIARGNGPDQRTTNGDIYVEVIGVTTSGAGNTDSLPLRHDVPYLIR